MEAASRTDLLVSLAEISVTLLGFAAIVSVFRGRGGGWRPDGRFWGMVTLSFSTFVLALLPIAFVSAMVRPGVTWGICSTSLALVAAGNTIVGVRVYGIERESGVPYNPYLQGFYLGVLGVVATLGVANAGVFFEARFWVYIAALVLLQFLTASTFVRLLYIWLTRE